MSEFAYLGDCPLFQGLSLEQRAAVYGLCELALYAEGETIFSEGDASDLVFVVCEGHVRISIQTSGAGEEALAICGPGDPFGEVDLLSDEPAARSANAIAHTACELATLSRAALLELTERDPELGYRLARNAITGLGERIRRTNQKLRFFAAANLFG